MARVVTGGSTEFNALVYGQPNQHHANFLGQRLSAFSDQLTEASRGFFANSRQMFDEFYGSDAMRLARAAVQRVASIFQIDTITYLKTVERLQTAPPAMQRWIMAEPTVREMFHQQRCDGYSDSYVDLHPKDIGVDHYDYRRVTDGVITENPDGSISYRIDVDDIIEGDVELTLADRSDILDTWDVVANLMTNGDDDITSVFGSKL